LKFEFKFKFKFKLKFKFEFEFKSIAHTGRLSVPLADTVSVPLAPPVSSDSDTSTTVVLVVYYPLELEA